MIDWNPKPLPRSGSSAPEHRLAATRVAADPRQRSLHQLELKANPTTTNP